MRRRLYKKRERSIDVYLKSAIFAPNEEHYYSLNI